MLNNINPFESGDLKAIRDQLNAVNSKAQDAAKLDKAASDFEALFINHMLKTMRESSMKTDLFSGGKGEEVYTSMLDQELSTTMSEGEGLGLKKALLGQLMQQAGLSADGPKELDTGAFTAPINKSSAIREFQSHLSEKGFVTPLQGRISSGYGIRKDPINGNHRFHEGTDIAAPEGTPIHPAMDGKVIFSGKMKGYGNIVEIQHDNGYISRYAHNSKNLVKEGDLVTTSDTLGLVGSTGRATGPHLHFEIKVEGYAINPVDMVNFG